MDTIFEILASRCDDEGFTRADDSDIDKWKDDLGLNLPDFLDQMGAEIAKRYQAGERSFEFCDSLVNDLWGVLIQRHVDKVDRWPDLLYEVYDAFDAGEYHRRPDRSDDPIAEFTNTSIATIVARLK
jgi:hypothetical protein